MAQRSTRLWLVPVFVIASLVIAGTVVLAQAPEWCVPPADGSPFGCAEITIKPDGLVGDFAEAGVPLAAAQNPARLVLPPGSHTINVTNIVSTEAGFGTLFVYRDAAANAYVNEGQLRSVTVTAQKQYIRGTLAVTCDIRSAVEGDSVGCQVTIDGVVQPDVLAAAARRDYTLDPGSHTVSVAVVGDLAALWSPASQQRSVTIYASATPARYNPRFDKKGHLFLALDKPGVVGDFYLNGTLVASQVATFDMWVDPNKSHKLEVRNTFDPAANGVYKWRDATQWASVGSNRERTVTFRLQKQWLQGFFKLTCQISGLQPGDNAYCQPTIDGVSVAPVQPGTTGTFNLNPGAHDVTVIMGPESDWISDPYYWQINITAGGSVSRTSAYQIEEEPAAAPTPTAPPGGSGLGTIMAVNMTGNNSTCRITISGNGSVWFVDAPASIQLPAGTYAWQAFFGPRGQTNQFGFILPANGLCVFTCYDTYVTHNC